MEVLSNELKDILNIGIALTSEKSYPKLLDMIIDVSMEITSSDAGTLYIMTPEGLRFMIMRNKTLDMKQGGGGEPVDMPSVPLKEENVCAYCAIHKECVNIEDVYKSDKFDFSGPRNYDAITGYHTTSMLVIPLENHDGELLGVLQLINALDENGKIKAYTWADEQIVYSMASQTSVTMSNMKYVEEIKDMLYSVATVMTTAIDEQTPYNANHTFNVAKYIGELVDYVNKVNKVGKTEICFNANEREQVVLAALLHDIGKLVIPLDVMNKMTRLDQNKGMVLQRFELLRSYIHIDYLEGRISESEWKTERHYLEDSKDLIEEADGAGFLPDDVLQKIEVLSQKQYTKKDGECIAYLTHMETVCLMVRKGTLTQDERKIMENHAAVTAKLLGNMRFTKDFNKVVEWASKHHECLDGSGYPNHIAGEELDCGARMLSIIDIYEALTSIDRPYKKAMPSNKAISILESMVEEGKLDGEMVQLLKEYLDEKKEEEQENPIL